MRTTVRLFDNGRAARGDAEQVGRDGTAGGFHTMRLAPGARPQR